MNSSTIETRMPWSAGPSSGSRPAALARPITRGIARIVSRRRRRRHIEALMTLDDRTLRDIGVSRADVCIGDFETLDRHRCGGGIR